MRSRLVAVFFFVWRGGEVAEKRQLLATNYPSLNLSLRNVDVFRAVLSSALHTSKSLSRRVSRGPQVNSDEELVCYNGNTRTKFGNINSRYPIQYIYLNLDKHLIR